MEKRSIFTHAVRGFSDLEYTGRHPGVKLAAWLVVIGGLAGLQRNGLLGAEVGVVLSCALYIPMLLISSIIRSKEHDNLEYAKGKDMENALKRDWSV